jgi:3-hydroxyacyl-CoA dehydrogenase
MAFDKPIRRIAIVGTGTIGASWAAEFLAKGFDVIATDPAPNAEANLRKYIDAAWPSLTAFGLAKGASRERLSFTPAAASPRLHEPTRAQRLRPLHARCEGLIGGP